MRGCAGLTPYTREDCRGTRISEVNRGKEPYRGKKGRTEIKGGPSTGGLKHKRTNYRASGVGDGPCKEGKKKSPKESNKFFRGNKKGGKNN